MNRLTKLEAINRSIIMWEKLAESGGDFAEKRRIFEALWPRNKKRGEDASYCWLCLYAKGDCKRCPAFGLWNGENKSNFIEGEPCYFYYRKRYVGDEKDENGENEYIGIYYYWYQCDWNYITMKSQRQEYAQEIVEILYKAKERLLNDSNKG